MLVYCAIFPNGKKYIGATTRTLEKRISDHKAKYKQVDNKFYRALRKYGFDSVEFRIIKHFETKKDMFRAEQILINRHKTNINGYNTTIGGEGNQSRIITDEERKKISLAQKKRFEKEEEREKTRQGIIKWHEKNKEAFLESRAKVNEKFRTDEYRQKASEKQLAFLENNPDHIEKMSLATKLNHDNNPEIKAKISRSLGGDFIEVFKDGEMIKMFNSLSECCRELDLNIGNVGKILKGERNHTKGYTFKKAGYEYDYF